MKNSLLLLLLILCFIPDLQAQSMDPCASLDYGVDNTMHEWCYDKSIGDTKWDPVPSPYKPYIYNRMPFRLLYPKDWEENTSKKYPLLVLLHGIGERGNDNNHQLEKPGSQHWNAWKKGKFDGFIMVPQNNTSSGLFSSLEYTQIPNFVRYAIKNLRVDEFRVFAEGFSAGGTAAWELANKNPTMFAGLIVMSAADGKYKNWVNDLKYTAIYHSQGGRDKMPSPATGNSVANAFQNAGANYKYNLYPDLDHGTWWRMYGEPDFFPFMMRNSMLRIHSLYFKYNFCEGEEIRGTLGVKQGFLAYQWEKDGQIIEGANSNELPFYGRQALGTYRVRIQSTNGWSEWADSEAIELKQTTATATPTITASGPTALPTADGTNTVTLLAPEGYQDYKWYKGGIPIQDATYRSYLVTAAGSYSVSVTEQLGCASALSAPIKVTYNTTNNISAPTALSVATVNASQLILSWKDQSNNETGFELYRSRKQDGPWTLAAQLQANSGTYMDEGLASFTRYYYRLRAVNQNGGSTYAAASGKTRADERPPMAPTNLEVVYSSHENVRLSWQPSADAGDGPGSISYEVFINNKTVKAGTTSHTTIDLTNLEEKKYYNFVVRAIDQTGRVSEWSNQVSAGTFINGLFYSLYQGDISTVHDIEFQRLIKTGQIPHFDIITPMPASLNGLFGYTFEGYISIPASGDYTFFTLSDDGSTLEIDGTEVVNNDGLHELLEQEGTIALEQGIHQIKVYYFGNRGQQEKLEVYWQSQEAGISKEIIPAAAFTEESTMPPIPAAPSGLTAASVDHQRIMLKWNDNSNNEKGFEIYRSTSNGEPFTYVKTVAANSKTYTDTKLKAATTYYYKLRAVSSAGESDYAGRDTDGNWANATTAEVTGTLETPTNLEATRYSTTSMRLSWNDNTDDEDGFEVARSLDGNNYHTIGTSDTDVTTFTDANMSMAVGNIYYYRVRATNTNSNSDWSPVAMVVVEDDDPGNGSTEFPVITNFPTVAIAPAGEKTTINFGLSDPNGDELALITRYMPSFARVEVIDAATGAIILEPSLEHIGYYSGMQLTVSDGVLETDISFSIAVTNSEVVSTYVNMGPSNAAAERPWNNVTFPTASAMMMHENLVNEKNEATGYSLVAQSHFDKERLYGDDSGNNTGVFPDIVTKSAFIVNNTGTATFDILGLDPEKRYNFVFFGSNILGSHGGYTSYSIGDQRVALSIQSNVDKTVQLNGIQAADGKASISVRGDDNYFKGGYLNAMVIEEYGADQFLRPGRLQAYATSRTTIALRWDDKSHQETGFEIERRQLPDGDFTLVHTLEANTSSYIDEGLSENTAYEYRLRAVSETLQSAYSEAIQATTLKYQVLVNANYSTNQDNTNAAAPWNNLDQDTKTDFIWSDLKDNNSKGTGINLKIIQNFDGNGDIGADANNSGIYPDPVIKSFYFTEAGRTAKLGISGLDDNFVYNFRFLGSSVFAGGENGVTEYRIGNKKSTLDVQDNINNTAIIRDVRPENGIVYLEVEAGAQESHFAEEGGTGRYGYLNSLVIEAMASQQETLPAASPEEPEEPQDPEEPEDPEGSEEPPVVTGVDQTLAPEPHLTIYPNPVQHELFIEYHATTAGPCYLQLVDLMGRTIHTQEFTAKADKNIWKLTLENQSMKNGMYLLKIRTADFNSKVIRFMKH